MSIIEIILIAFALALDAFSVALAAGAYLLKTDKRQRFRLSFHFGLFQFFMPIIGWIGAENVVTIIQDYDHWIAFAILIVVGGKMLKDAFSSDDNVINTDITKGIKLISLSVATSIDALAVGFSIGLLGDTILFPAIVIGIVAAGMTLIGIIIGEKLSSKYGKKSSLIGGTALVLIGIKIVLEHLEIISF